MNTNKKAKFALGNESDFYRELKSKVDHYFSSSGYSKYANTRMILKSLVVTAMFAGSYTILLGNVFSHPALVYCMFILFGVSSALIAFNISHDASHGAYSRKTKINNLLCYTFNLIGVNSYIWNIKHNLSHHTYTNIPGYDSDIEQAGILRVTKLYPRKPMHRYQHIYMPVVYLLYSMFLVFIKDFKMFLIKHHGNKKTINHPVREHIILYSTKLFYIIYAIILPFIFIEMPWYQILVGMILMHLVTGAMLALIFVPVHALDDSPFPEVDENGCVNSSWAIHQVETTTNIAPESKIINWITGGLNTHIAHHLFPSICHIHYYKLSGIIRETAQQYGIRHRDNTLVDAIHSHFQLLKSLGREN